MIPPDFISLEMNNNNFSRIQWCQQHEYLQNHQAPASHAIFQTKQMAAMMTVNHILRQRTIINGHGNFSTLLNVICCESCTLWACYNVCCKIILCLVSSYGGAVIIVNKTKNGFGIGNEKYWNVFCRNGHVKLMLESEMQIVGSKCELTCARLMFRFEK